MSLIYEPSGKAHEYSPLALNVYSGCDHGCKYCYLPTMGQMAKSNTNLSLRPDFIRKLEKELPISIHLEQILLSFLCDPYNTQEPQHRQTRQALTLLKKHNRLVAILTKGGNRCLEDFDLIRSFGAMIKVGTTLTFNNPSDSSLYEPNAAPVKERILMLKSFHDAGIKTFVSIEPVIDPAQSLDCIMQSLPWVDQYKIGKLNHDPAKERTINWKKFLQDTLQIMRTNKKEFYIKDDLADYGRNLLNPGDTNAEKLTLKMPSSAFVRPPAPALIQSLLF